MAVTRIKNNQITTASGNIADGTGINAAAKLQDYTITSTKIANSLVYGSDLTVSGNLTVNGQTTTIDTISTLIEDPIITLADGQTSGSPTVDIGVLGLRGSQNSSFLGWNEANTEFAAILTSTTSSNTVVVIDAYADFKANNITATGNLDVTGNIAITGNITGNVTVEGNIAGGNLLTTGLVSATSNVIGGNILTAGQVSATGNVDGGNVNTAGQVVATGNVSGGNVTTIGQVSATGNVTGGNILFGTGIVSGTGNIYANSIFANISGNIDAAGNITEIQFNGPGDILSASSNFTYNTAVNTFTVGSGGNVDAGNVNLSGRLGATGNVQGGNITTAGLITATGNITGGNIDTAGVVSATGNVVGGNISTAGAITAAGNIVGANFNTAGNLSAAGNVTANNVNTANIVSQATMSLTALTGDIVIDAIGGNINASGSYINNVLDPIQAQDAATKEYVDNAVSTGITIHEPVYVESPTALNATYAQGGTTATVTDTIAGNTVVFSSAISPQPNDQYWFTNSFNGIVANTAYFVVSAPNTSAAVLSTTYNGAPVTNITSGSGLTEGVRINSGVGATLTNAGANATLAIDGVTLSNGQRALIYTQANAVHNGVYVVSEAGNATTAWQLTRSNDMNTYAPDDINGMDAGDYFYVQAGDTGAGESYVMTAPIGPFVIGFNNLTFTQFSASQVYTANTNAGLSLIGTVFSAKIDNNTTAFDGGGNIIVKAGANLTTPNIGAATGTSLSVTGNVESGNVTTIGVVSATGNITGGNVDTAGQVTATGNIAGGNVTTIGVVSATGNVDAGNVNTAGQVTATGNITGGNVSTAGQVTATGNITGGNVSTAGLITATGNITGGNVATAGQVSATGNVDAGNLNTAGQVVATGNVSGGNVTTVGVVSATGNVDGGNVNTAGTVTATGNIAGGNVTTAGNVVATGNVSANNITATTSASLGNIVITGDNITDTNGRINFNEAVADVDFAVNGTAANIMYIDAGTNTTSFGSDTQVANALVTFNSTNSIKLPVGNTATRPGGAPTTGMIRFNTSLNSLELYNNTEWTTVGATEFTVIGDEQFAGDGVTTVFTLSSIQTTNSCIVSINGVVQIPTTAYSVSGTTLTFTEAPAIGDLIDVRQITTTTTVLGLSNGNVDLDVSTTNVVVTGGNLVVAAGGFLYGDGTYLTNVGGGNVVATKISEGTTSVDIDGPGGSVVTNVANSNVIVTATTQTTFTGNVNPSANATMTLGNATNQWQSLYVSGNTIFLGGIALGTSSGNLVFNSNTVVTANATGTSTTTGNVEIIGNVTSSNLSVTTGTVTAGNIVNGNGNGVGNIGSSSNYFNTVFAKATSAQYADLAEKYTADAEYAPGTVVVFGGSAEVTVNATDADRRVAGVVSTNPSYIMNASLEGTVATVALTGRVPTLVTGPVKKGDLMVAAGLGRARAEADPKVGTVIGKALEDFDGAEGTIEVVVGRF